MTAVLRPLLVADLDAVQAFGGTALSDGLITQKAFVGYVALIKIQIVGYIAGFRLRCRGDY